MNIIQKAINGVFGGKKKKALTNNRVPVMWGINNQNNTSLKSLHIGLNYDGTLKIWVSTNFALLRKNYIVWSAMRFLAGKIWWYGFYFVDKKGNTVQWTQADKKDVENFFSVPSLHTYIYETLAYLLMAGQKVSTATELNKFGKGTNKSKINNLDPRMLTIQTDQSTGDVLEYIYSNKALSKTFQPEQVIDYILFPDFDRENYGQSPMESIIIDIVTDYAMSNRQLYFYMNNATPWTVYLTDGEMLRDETVRKDLETKILEKFGGNANIGKPLISSAIKDVKTIEIPTLDIINEREQLMKIVTMVFGIDPRVLGFMKEQWGSYAEIDAIARNMTNSKIEEWWTIVENIMNQEFSKYRRELPYRIKLDNILFKNIESDKKMSLEELKAGVITPEEYKTLYDI